MAASLIPPSTSTMGHNSRLVIMFRDPTKEPSAANTDQQPISEYHDKFVGAGYVPVSFPVIEPHSTLTPQWLLAEIFPRTSNFTGLIFTSSNAVKALSGAYQAALASPLGFIDLLPSPTATAVEMVESVLQPQWQRLLSLPIFVVGKATATACHNLLGPTAPAPLVIHGQDSGSAVNLLKIITNSLTASPQSTHLLFLSGDRRRSTLPDGLSERGIQFSEVTVYETRGVAEETISSQLDELLRTSGCDCPEWLVFFSPSGVDATLGPLRAKRWRGQGGPKVAAIGQTTRGHLTALGIQSKATAPEPTPSSLVQAIVAADGPSSCN